MAVNAADGTPVPFVNIYDLRTHRGTAAAIDGSFSFTVLQGDSIKFSSIGFQDVYLYADSTIPKEPFKIFFKKATYNLKPITVNPFMNDEAFRKAFMGIGADSNAIKLDMPKLEKNRGPIPATGAPSSTLKFGADKNQKNIDRQNDAIKKFAKENAKSGRYNRDMILRVTKIPEDKVDDLINFCDLKADIVEGVNDYDLIVLIKNCYKHYMQQHPDVKPRP